MRNISLKIIHRIWWRNYFLKSQNWAYLWINSLKLYTVCFYGIPSWGLSKYIETKQQTTCFYLIWILSADPTKWSNTLKQSVFDHFMGLALERLQTIGTSLLGSFSWYILLTDQISDQSSFLCPFWTNSHNGNYQQ